MSDSDDSATVEYTDMGLGSLTKLLSDLPVAKVGVLGDKNARKGSNTNAEVGAKHEFGEEGMPVRSFLRVPIIENFQKYLESAGFSETTLRDAIKARSLIEVVKKFGLIGEQIVSDAFSSSGFGKWKPSVMKFKKNHQTLVETQQLRNSITSEVVKGES